MTIKRVCDICARPHENITSLPPGWYTLVMTRPTPPEDPYLANMVINIEMCPSCGALLETEVLLDIGEITKVAP